MYIHTYVYIYMNICIYTYIYIFIYMYICIFIHIHISFPLSVSLFVFLSLFLVLCGIENAYRSPWECIAVCCIGFCSSLHRVAVCAATHTATRCSTPRHYKFQRGYPKEAYTPSKEPCIVPKEPYVH